jgi:hypothetical protein
VPLALRVARVPSFCFSSSLRTAPEQRPALSALVRPRRVAAVVFGGRALALRTFQNLSSVHDPSAFRIQLLDR